MKPTRIVVLSDVFLVTDQVRAVDELTCRSTLELECQETYYFPAFVLPFEFAAYEGLWIAAYSVEGDSGPSIFRILTIGIHQTMQVMQQNYQQGFHGGRSHDRFNFQS